ncbi:MAG: DUF3021 domain-containing protein [Lachnospirales bacterium]
MKKIFDSILIGALIGLFINFICMIITSRIYGTGEFLPATPSLIVSQGNELNAFIFQGVTSMIFGAICSVTSLIYSNEKLSTVFATLIHFSIIFISYTVMSKINYWSLGGINYASIIFFLLIYVVLWILSYTYDYFLIKHMNKKLNN